MRSGNKWANLPPFAAGVRSHTESMKAAMLLQNHNLEMLVKTLGKEILDDDNLELYLAAMYNGGPGPVIEAVRRARHKETDWRQELRKLKKTNESLEYLKKLDYLLKRQPSQ